MKPKVKLSEILDAMDFQSEETSAYLDTRTGKVVTIDEEESRLAEDDELDEEDEGEPEESPDDDEEGAGLVVPDWEQELVETARAVLNDTEGRFLQLPTEFDIHEYEIMADFSRSLEDETVSVELQDAIQGSGAFRRFKDAIHRHGIAERWYEFRDEAVKQIAIGWCEAHEIKFIDDTRRGKNRDKAQQASKKAKAYEKLLGQVRAVLEGERDPIANAANTVAILFQSLPQVSWAGFYFLRGDALVLGPFQGKPACTRIALGQGVCGTAAAQRKTLVVPNIHEFPGHIACDPASNSEIVVPIVRDGRLVGVLDLDSTFLDRFDEEDRAGLEAIAEAFASATEF